jgi:DNA-binding NarL/FixJ family response regulator
VPAPLDATDARLLAGRAHAAAGDTDRAKALLQRVAVEAGRGSALRLRDDAARQLRGLGTHVSAAGRRAAPSRHEDPHLTSREEDVASLVGRGHTNKQVAAALHLSVGTVENILTRVYGKLGVRSRSQLARKLAHR